MISPSPLCASVRGRKDPHPVPPWRLVFTRCHKRPSVKWHWNYPVPYTSSHLTGSGEGLVRRECWKMSGSGKFRWTVVVLTCQHKDSVYSFQRGECPVYYLLHLNRYCVFTTLTCWKMYRTRCFWRYPHCFAVRCSFYLCNKKPVLYNDR